MLSFLKEYIDSRIDEKLSGSNDKNLLDTNKRLQEEIITLCSEVKELKSKLDLVKSKRTEKVRKILDAIPEGAKGFGSVLVLENDSYKTVEFTTRQELSDLVDQAEKGEIELVIL